MKRERFWDPFWGSPQLWKLTLEGSREGSVCYDLDNSSGNQKPGEWAAMILNKVSRM